MNLIDSLYESLAYLKMNTIVLLKLTHIQTLWVIVDNKGVFISNKLKTQKSSQIDPYLYINKLQSYINTIFFIVHTL